jgi:hypothetical protein
MPILHLSIDELLTTTRSMRKRLDMVKGIPGKEKEKDVKGR